MQKIKIKNNIIEDIVIIEDEQKRLQGEHNLNIIRYSVSDEVIDAIKSKPLAMRTMSENKKLETRENIDRMFQMKLSQYDDYKELVEIPFNGDYDKKTEILISQFKEFDDRVEKSYTPRVSVQKINELINHYRNILSETDYIIIKTYEAKLSMLDAPYSSEYFEEILSKRQNARDEINALEMLRSNELKK
jgi:hypothetical protein